MGPSSGLVALGVGYAVGAGIAAATAVVVRRDVYRWLLALGVIALIVTARVLLSRWAPEGLLAVWASAGVAGRVLALVGFLAALPLLPFGGVSRLPWLRDAAGMVGLAAVLGAGGFLVFKERVGFASPTRDVGVPKGFGVRLVAEIPYSPLRVAAEGEQVFVSYEDVAAGHLNGGILGFRPRGAGFEERTVAASPFFFRPHGLAVKNGKLFVSRSGLSPHAVHGQVYYDGVGALTELEDRDGDGKYEHWHDVVTGLTGVRGPDTLHQSSGVAVAADGTVYVANSHDHNRSLDPHPLAGVIVKQAPGETGPGVYAHGFRNPWALIPGPNGVLFATDNDIEENPGDEINVVLPGKHYGHPYVVAGEEGAGFTPPLINEPNRVLTGLAYVPADAWPAPYGGCLYVTDLLSGNVLRLELTESKEQGFVVKSKTKFAQAPSPIDLAFDKGKLYILSRHHRRLYVVEAK